MKKYSLVLGVAAMLLACGQKETSNDKASRASADSVATDSVVAAKPRNCQSVVEADKLNKPDVYQESGKNLKVSLTLLQDESSTDADGGCYFNNVVNVVATRKSGKSVFSRKLLKDDLVHFTKNDEAVEKGILQKATYSPTFNSQKYVTLSMRLIEPGTKKTTDFLVYLNFHGEVIKVK